MCCVVGYIGKHSSRQHILDGLTRLEYRGYDSAGFACLLPDTDFLAVEKSIGEVVVLGRALEESFLDGRIGIGHTRWATHGGITKENAHPLVDCKQERALVHNGIIENHVSLRERLSGAGHRYVSATDTENVAHFLEEIFKSTDDPITALQALMQELRGAYAFVFLARRFPNFLLIARYRSPLYVGRGDSEHFVASDPLAFAGKIDCYALIPDAAVGIVSEKGPEIYNVDGKRCELVWKSGDFLLPEGRGRGDFEHHMLKEIYEQKSCIKRTVDLFAQFQWPISIDARSLECIEFVACGSSHFATQIARYFFEEIAGIKTQAHIASEFRTRRLFLPQNTLYLFVSQSGETADTLEALRLVQQAGGCAAVLTNIASSTMAHEASAVFITQAQREISVASTKSFSAQIATLFLLGYEVALQRGHASQKELDSSKVALLQTATVLEGVLEQYKVDIIERLAPFYATYESFIFVGRHTSYPIAQEAALKLREIAYRFVDCYPAGELKHGPIALVEPRVPTFVFSVLHEAIYVKLVANAQEIKARGGRIFAYAFEGQDELISLADDFFIIPRVEPLLASLAQLGLAQFFAYRIAKELGRPIDKPRNLAKSVTVE